MPTESDLRHAVNQSVEDLETVMAARLDITTPTERPKDLFNVQESSTEELQPEAAVER